MRFSPSGDYCSTELSKNCFHKVAGLILGWIFNTEQGFYFK